MLEIYSEQVRDLLNAKTMQMKGGLKVRQHPTKGFYGMYMYIELSCPEKEIFCEVSPLNTPNFSE